MTSPSHRGFLVFEVYKWKGTRRKESKGYFRMLTNINWHNIYDIDIRPTEKLLYILGCTFDIASLSLRFCIIKGFKPICFGIENSLFHTFYYVLLCSCRWILSGLLFWVASDPSFEKYDFMWKKILKYKIRGFAYVHITNQCQVRIDRY